MADGSSVAGDAGHRSLEEVHSSVPIPGGSWPKRMFAFAGPAYMVSVGYMDPGNWATDLEGGARFGYALIWVLLMSNIMAVLLQTLSARLGIVTGRDLAQACRDSYHPVVRWILFVLCEIAIAACDLAEVLGTALGINLLSGMFLSQPIPMEIAIVITVFDVFILLAIQKFGIRKMEAMIIGLVSLIGMCFIVEIFLSKPDPVGIAKGFIPTRLTGDMLFVAIGILGATVMPHNLYLHSALVQSRNIKRSDEGIRQACKFNFIDSAIALNCAFFVNAAILIVAAATFFSRGVEVAEIQTAHKMLEGLLGTKIAPAAFAIALILAGQSSTVTGTLAGQITMEGFLKFRIRPWLRRLITRSIAVIPAVIIIYITGESGTTKLLVLSQVILSMQLPFAVIPLVKFTSSRARMGQFASPLIVVIFAWVVATIIVYLNAQLVYEKISGWSESAGDYRWLVLATAVPLSLGLGGLLLYMTFRRESTVKAPPRGVETIVDRVVASASASAPRSIRKIGVAVEAEESDAAMLGEAMAMARTFNAEILLLHIVEGVGGQYHGAQAGDVESHRDAELLRQLAGKLTETLADSDVPEVKYLLGFGSVPREIIRLVKENGVDLLVLGSHGHRGLSDVIRGTTIDAVRHGLTIPVMAVRSELGK